MRRFICIAFAGLAAAMAVGPMAATATALPSVLLLPGESGSVLFESLANAFETRLETEQFLLTGEGLDVNLHFPNSATNLGTFKLNFLNMVDPQQENLPCDTAGDGAGKILLTGAFHLVFDSLSVLGVAALLLFEEVNIACEAIAIKLKGNALALFKPLKTELLPTQEGEFILRCSATAGVPEDRKWWNAAGVEQVPRMEMNFAALGFEQACINVASPVKLKPQRMVEIMG
jgi:hypothetical protein